MISHSKYEFLQDTPTHLSDDIGTPIQILNVPLPKIVVQNLSRRYKATLIVAQSKELKELTMSRDTANAISSWEIAKSERARTWWIGLLCSRTDNLPSPAPSKTNSWKVVEQLQTTIQTTYQFRPTNKWTDTFAGLQFFRSKTNYPQERSTQTCVEQTHPQSKNAQDQHLRDTEGTNREFNNPNSSSVIGLYRWTR